MNWKVPPTFLKRVAVFLIAASIVGWPTTALTIAKSEPPVVLGLSWMAILLTGFAFYAASQDGEDIDTILENQGKIMKHLEVANQEKAKAKDPKDLIDKKFKVRSVK